MTKIPIMLHNWRFGNLYHKSKNNISCQQAHWGSAAGSAIQNLDQESSSR